MINHRGPEFAAMLARILDGIKPYFGTTSDVAMITTAGTGGLEAAVVNVLSPGDRVLGVSIGSFGDRFAKIARTYGADVTKIEVEWGQAADPATLRAELERAPGYKAVLLTHNETSTGVAIPVTRVSGADGLMVWDATSAAGGLPVNPADFDVYYFAPQKAFGSEGGLWLALMSPAALDRAREIKETGRYIPPFLDLQTAIDNSLKDQTYNTPSISTILMTAEQVDWFNENGGLPFATSRSAASADALYRWTEKVDRRVHPHAKPAGLIRRLIAAVTEPGDLVVDPAAGGFTVMHVAHELGRRFVGCDIAYGGL
jgi:phosphoserine aminotransferase